MEIDLVARLSSVVGRECFHSRHCEKTEQREVDEAISVPTVKNEIASLFARGEHGARNDGAWTIFR